MSITLRETATGALWHYIGHGEWIVDNPSSRSEADPYATMRPRATMDLLDAIAEGLKVTA